MASFFLKSPKTSKFKVAYYTKTTNGPHCGKKGADKGVWPKTSFQNTTYQGNSGDKLTEGLDRYNHGTGPLAQLAEQLTLNQ